ncbi:peptidoglycan recognition protein family protein [Xylanimonas sp. McL0601]|uniref:peptidoglycan recognition protein family protein n=1 Tax=Xylanimonas sp. McL0601 TaxID=3414739 RepID=UPI003CE7A7D5
MKTILSPNKRHGRISPIRLVVLHTTESGEISAGAEANASFFSRPATNASSHIVVDNDSEVRCVPDADTAFAAPGANADGLQLEMVGRAGQGVAGWSDAYSRSELERAAHIVAGWCEANHIPVRHLSVDQVADGVTRGIAGHVDVTNAFHKSTHTDPGDAFPWPEFLARVAQLVDGKAPGPELQQGPEQLEVDGKWGSDTTRRLQQLLRMTNADGVVSHQQSMLKSKHPGLTTGWDFSGTPGDGGSRVVLAHQRVLRARGRYDGELDGKAGPQYFRAIQADVRVDVDGVIHRPSAAVQALQRRMNDGHL